MTVISGFLTSRTILTNPDNFWILLQLTLIRHFSFIQHHQESETKPTSKT